MPKTNAYKVKDEKLASQGKLNVEWAKTHMKSLLGEMERFKKEKPFKKVVVGLALHVTKETAVLVEALVAGGAKVTITGCNPLSTQDDVAAYLAKNGVEVFAWKGETKKEYYDNLESVIERLRYYVKQGKKIVTIDDGCDLVSLVHTKHKDLIPEIIAGTEETTTGVIRLKAMEKDNALKYPVIAVNDNETKHLFDNYYGTGQSTIDGLLRATSILIAGKKFVVVGYGNCGKGVSKIARAMGAIVTIVEADPIKALQARMDGFEVMPMSKAASLGDIFVTVTGNRDIITLSEAKKMKDGAVLANSGHFNIEIDVEAIKKAAKKVDEIRPGLNRYQLGNKILYICGEGRLVNLSCAEGHPSQVMALSFLGQSLAVEYGIKNEGKLESKVYSLPKKIDRMIASLELKAEGISNQKLTTKQKEYMNSWKIGT